LRKLASDKI
jgi:hypothetical protein